MKRTILYGGALIVGILLNFLPLSISMTTPDIQSPNVALQPVVEYNPKEVAPICAMMGMSAYTVTRGWPFKSYGGGDVCDRTSYVYPLGIVANILTVVAATFIIDRSRSIIRGGKS